MREPRPQAIARRSSEEPTLRRAPREGWTAATAPRRLPEAPFVMTPPKQYRALEEAIEKIRASSLALLEEPL